MSYCYTTHSGYLEIHGEDVYDFLQRQTTNDVQTFDGASALTTVLTSPKARILDVLTLLTPPGEINEGNTGNSIHMLTLPGYGAKTFKFLSDRIFFMDKVAISDTSNEYLQIELFGKNAPETITRMGVQTIPEPGKITSMEFHGHILRIIGKIKNLQAGFRILIPEEIEAQTKNLLGDCGSQPVDEEQYNIARIEAGLPREGYELTSEYTPLEVGLTDMISETKGCYTGQEVIARQINYDKVTQHLSGIKLQECAQIAERLWIENKSVGVITSVGYSSLYGEIALAVIKRPYNQPGTELFIGESRDYTKKTVVVGLPFSNQA